MSDNKYVRYLNDPSLRPNYDREDSTSHKIFGTIETIAGLAVTGTLGYGAVRSGALHDAGSNLMRKLGETGDTYRQIGARFSAIKQGLDGQSLLHIYDDVTQDGIKRHLVNNLEELEKHIDDPLRGRTASSVRTYDEYKQARLGLAKEAFANLRYTAIKEHLQGQHLPSEMVEDIANSFSKINHKGLKKQNERYTAELTREGQRGVLKETINKDFDYRGVEEERVLDVLQDVMDKFGNPGEFLRKNKVLQAQYVKTVKKQQADLFEELIRSHQQSDSFFNSQIQKLGYTPLSVGEAMKRGLINKRQMPSTKASIKASIKSGNKDFERGFEVNLQRQFERLITKDKRFADITYDKNLFVDKTGKLVDYSHVTQGASNSLSFLATNFEVPFVRINPLRLTHWITLQGVKDAPTFKVFARGTVQPFIGDGSPLSEGVAYANGKLISASGNIIGENTYLGSSRFGVFPRIAAQIQGKTRKEITREDGAWGFIKHYFDIGHQESQSEVKRWIGSFMKGHHPLWEPNIIKQAEENKTVSIEQTKALYNLVNQNAPELSERVTSILSNSTDFQSLFGGIIDFSELGTDEGVINTLGRLVKAQGGAAVGHQSPLKQSATGKQLSMLWNKYNSNPLEFAKNVHTVGGVGSPYTEAMPFIDVFDSGTKMVRDIDDVKKLIHQEVIYQLGLGDKLTVGKLISQNGSALNKADVAALNHVDTAAKMRELYAGLSDTDEKSIKATLENVTLQVGNEDYGAVAGTGDFYKNIRTVVKKYSPIWGPGPGQEPPNYYPSGHLVINKAHGYGDLMQTINDITKGGGDFGDVIKALGEGTIGQLGIDFGFGFRAGRNNPSKVTTATVFSQFGITRLNEALSKFGWGLSNASLGSTQDAYVNLMLKRVLGPAAAITGLAYLNYQSEDLGVNPKKKITKTYAGMTLDMATVRDTLGFTGIYKRMKQYMPGVEHLTEDSVPGMALRTATFGLFGNDKTREELVDYYQHGTTPIRQGRWWGIGSNTPWYGGKIQYFAPNLYRRTMSDYKMTDVLYGSEDEYWAHSWLPTPKHPLAPIRHFLTDPYHWELKHKEDRPYPVTGGYPEIEELPVVGPLLNKGLGELGFKAPRQMQNLEKAHREYLEGVNELIKEQYLGYGKGPSNLAYLISPGGRGQQVMLGSAVGGTGTGSGSGIGGGVGTGTGGEDIDEGEDIGGDLSSVPIIAPVAQGDMVPIYGKPGSNLSAQQLTTINRRAIQQYRSKSGSLRDPDFVENLRESVDPSSLGYASRETLYSLTEIGGIYGFGMTNLVEDIGARPQGKTLQSSSYMTSYGRGYWDLELGGMGIPILPGGSEISEIYRRFIPSNKYRRKQFNPVKNTMPAWMPGPEYLTDFQHGDPYVKIPGGEMRLPGAGYEALNPLHPDALFGQYGAFDRFKILGDVAPYSEQYKYYKSIVSQMNTAGMLLPAQKKEFAQVKEQIQKAKQKYDFTPYKFKYADITKQAVTVVRMIDDKTFLTKEFPGNPIRLAGIDLAAKDTEANARAKEMISKVIYPGAKVTIGMDADPLNSTANDTMKTIRAVVYDSGVSLNAKLARTKLNPFFGGETIAEERTTDDSAVGVNARFYQDEITVGKAWEWFAHLDTPFHTKFLAVRSPLEVYKRKEIYGKSWQSWQHPIQSFITPTIQSFATHNPLVAGAMGAGLGALFGATPMGRKIGATVGGTITALVASGRVFSEQIGSLRGKEEAWIPERRRKQREIEEYFDKLKYIKYSGLYEKAKALAWDKEKVDVDALLKEQKDGKSSKNAKMRSRLNELKRWLKINRTDPLASEEDVKLQLSNINEKLSEIAADRRLLTLGKYTQQALLYKATYESTLYAAEDSRDILQLFRALPKKDREFFPYFASAAPEEREEILRLVPKNQRRLYQQQWGMKVDPKENLDDYFKSHYLPQVNWAGWRPDVSLEDVKLKVIRNEAVDAQEMGYWEDDIRNVHGAPNINPFKPSCALTAGFNQNLSKVLRGAGLSNVLITHSIGPSTDEHMISLKIELEKDRRKDIAGALTGGLMPQFIA